MRTQAFRGTLALAVALATALGASAMGADAGQSPPIREQQTLDRLRTALERLPYYGVFDILAVGYDRGVVTLMGYAHRGSLKAEAVDAVRRVPGVDDVSDRIEVLPASQADDRIRSSAFYALYGDDFFSRYVRGGASAFPRETFSLLARFPAMQPIGTYPIHIIVKHLRVTLVGMVDSALDETVALTRARSVAGTLDVKDEVTARVQAK